MANKDNLIKLVAQKLGPDKLKQMVDQVEQTVGADPDVNAQSIDTIIQQFEFVAEHPDQYKDVLAKAIQSGVIDANTLPPEFDPVMVAVMLLAFYGLRERLQQRGQQQPQQPQMAHGGLSSVAQHLQSQGRGGDTMLAHINPMEAEALKRMGGSGTINPHTGLREFKGGLVGSVMKIVKAVAPIAVNFIPGIGPIAGAALGAGLGAINGGGIKGAVLGGLGAALGPGGIGQGLAGNIGSVANSAIGNIGGLSNEVLGAGVLGGATSALAGKNPIMGGLTAGLVSNYAPTLAAKYGDLLPTGMAQNMAQGAIGAANTGNSIQGIATGAGAAGLASLGSNLFDNNPVNANVNSGAYNSATGKFDAVAPDTIPQGQGTYGPNNEYIGQTDTGTTGATMTPSGDVVGGTLAKVAAATPQAASTGMSMTDMAKLAAVGVLLGGKTPQQAQQAVQDSQLTAQQKDAMLRSLTNYKFEPNMTTFPSQGTPGYDALMKEIQNGIMQTYTTPTFTEVPAKARGGKMVRQPQGALSQVSRLAQGAGTGRSDSIDAKLSDGEYVIDAETVALLGNGSTKAGAAMLDQMRQGIRQQKGKALAKGKFSPDAKSPLAYMKGGLK